MPKGPQGQKRPADVVGAAVMVARISIGEAEDRVLPEGQRQRGRAGAVGRAKKLPAERRGEIARKAAEARWGK